MKHSRLYILILTLFLSLSAFEVEGQVNPKKRGNTTGLSPAKWDNNSALCCGKQLLDSEKVPNNNPQINAEYKYAPCKHCHRVWHYYIYFKENKTSELFLVVPNHPFSENTCLQKTEVLIRKKGNEGKEKKITLRTTCNESLNIKIFIANQQKIVEDSLKPFILSPGETWTNTFDSEKHIHIRAQHTKKVKNTETKTPTPKK